MPADFGRQDPLAALRFQAWPVAPTLAGQGAVSVAPKLAGQGDASVAPTLAGLGARLIAESNR